MAKLVKIILFLSIVIPLLSTGCATSHPVQKLNPAIYYRHDLRVKVNDKKFNGIGVIPLAKDNRYKLEIEAPGKMDLLIIATCAGELPKEMVGYDYETTISMSDDFELRDSCLLRIEALEDKKGRHSWGIFDFQTKEETVPATMYCNGNKREVVGVDICESKEKLWQKIVFKEQMELATIDDRCSLGKNVGSEFEFRMPNRECVYYFRELHGTEVFRLTLIGYEEILVRGEDYKRWDENKRNWSTDDEWEF